MAQTKQNNGNMALEPEFNAEKSQILNNQSKEIKEKTDKFHIIAGLHESIRRIDFIKVNIKTTKLTKYSIGMRKNKLFNCKITEQRTLNGDFKEYMEKMCHVDVFGKCRCFGDSTHTFEIDYLDICGSAKTEWCFINAEAFLLKNFDKIVPPKAVVAVCLNPHSYEYPLFGYKLTRIIIPINSFWRGLQPIPATVQYLLWANDFDEIFNRTDSDVYLGKDWYLRKLK